MFDTRAIKSQAIQQSFKENIAQLCAVYYDAVTLADGDPDKLNAAGEKFRIGMKIAEDVAARCSKIAQLDA